MTSASFQEITCPMMSPMLSWAMKVRGLRHSILLPAAPIPPRRGSTPAATSRATSPMRATAFTASSHWHGVDLREVRRSRFKNQRRKRQSPPWALIAGGDVVGYYGNGPPVNGIHAFLRLKDGTFIKIDPPGTIADSAPHLDEEGYILRPAAAGESINQAGDVAGYFETRWGKARTVRRKDGTLVAILTSGAALKRQPGHLLRMYQQQGRHRLLLCWRGRRTPRLCAH